jgi:hypothetical protein
MTRRLSFVERGLLLDRPLHGLDRDEAWEHFELAARDDGARLGQLWQQHRAEVLVDWVTERPGTRPSAWWKHEKGLPAPPEIGAQTAYLAERGWLQPGELEEAARRQKIEAEADA